MTDRPPSPEDRTFDPDAEARPGSDPGPGYDAAVEADQAPGPEGDESEDGPDVGDVFRSGS